MESEAESEISMRETRRRIHTLLDDTFSTLKKYQKQLLKDDSPSMSPIIKKTDTAVNSLPRKYAGMQPALPEPAPAHGRATTSPPGGLKQRIIQSPYAPPFNSYNNPFADPMLTWDPIERQK